MKKNYKFLDNINFPTDLRKLTENDLLKTPNLGRKSLAEIKGTLAKYNLTLGLSLPDWKSPNAMTIGVNDE